MCSPSPDNNIGADKPTTGQTDDVSKGVPLVYTMRNNHWDACKTAFGNITVVGTGSNMIATATVLTLAITFVFILNQNPSDSDSTNYQMSDYNSQHNNHHHHHNHNNHNHNNHDKHHNNHNNNNYNNNYNNHNNFDNHNHHYDNHNLHNHNNNHHQNSNHHHHQNNNHDGHHHQNHHNDDTKLMKPNVRKPAAPASSMLSMLVDVSGSMRSMGNAVSTGCNSYLDEQRQSTLADGQSTQVLFSTFDNRYTKIHNAALKDIPTITDHDVQPRGSTALYDGIANIIRDTIAQLNTMETVPKHVGVFILTDGEENSSREWHRNEIRSQIKLLEAAPYNWKFYFAGANQDAIHNGVSLGWTPTRAFNSRAGKSP